MKAIYKILFSVELLHDYYNHRQAFEDLSLQPSPETEKILRGYRTICKVLKNKLYALIEVDNEGKPYISISKNTVLRFHLKAWSRFNKQNRAI
ncbi:MAG: hypothetical protein H7Y00_04775 [Fimbriimonadaceae bacterium]|nr:hypothetical protein [Chitinophagales bacterium]